MRATNYATAALRSAVDRVSTAVEGERNNTLYRETAGLAGLAAGDQIDPESVMESMRTAAASCGMSQNEASRAIAAAMRAGSRSPRRGGTRREQQRVSSLREYTRSAPDTQVPSDCAHLLQEVWRSCDHLSHEAEAYLDRRYLSYPVAMSYGCRHLQTQRVRDALNEADRKTLIRCGFLSDQHKGWAPLRGRRPGYTGIDVPVWHPAYDFPVAWRHRLFHPTSLKSIAQYGLPAWRDWPLGVRWWRDEHVSGGWHRWLFDRQFSRHVIVVEGEPDWIAMADAVGAAAWVLGDPLSGRAWPAHWLDLIDDRQVIAAYHADEAGDAAADRLIRSTGGQRLRGDVDWDETHDECAAVWDLVCPRAHRTGARTLAEELFG